MQALKLPPSQIFRLQPRPAYGMIRRMDLTAYRKRHRLTQMDIASLVGCNTATISKAEQGRVGRSVASRIVAVTGGKVTYADLWDRRDSGASPEP